MCYLPSRKMYIRICEWMKQNSLKINQYKTEYIIFSSKPDQYKHISLTVGRDIIHPSEYVRVLGVTLDSQMNMHQHIANTCQSTYMHIRKINSIRQYLFKNSTASPVNATVLTRLDYCNSVYTGRPQKSMHKLQLAQNSAARLISQTPRHHHITPILIELNWLTITKRCQYKLLVLTFKVLHSQALGYMSELFNWYTPARALRPALLLLSTHSSLIIGGSPLLLSYEGSPPASTISLIPNRSKTIKFGSDLLAHLQQLYGIISQTTLK